MPIVTQLRRLAQPASHPEPTDPAVRPVPPSPAARRRRVAGRVLTGLAGLLVFLALVVPERADQGGFAALLRIPVEGLLGAALLLVLPDRARRVMAALLGAFLGLLTIVRIIDLGFLAALARPFDPTLDWVLLDDGMNLLADSVGQAGAYGIVTGALVLAVALVVLATLAVGRLARVLAGRRAVATRVGAALAAAWVGCAVLGVQIVPGVPVAAGSAVGLAYQKARQVPEGLRDRRDFAAASRVDAFRDVPGERLLAGLRGKDVVIAFVESYGRDAVEDPGFAAPVDAVLDSGTRELHTAGFATRSAFLTSPTAGGGSWLAHATLLSGLWVDNQRRYVDFVSGDRLTLVGAFRRAGWRAVGVMPANTFDWPEAAFFGYHRVYDAHALGYRGPRFGFSTMPDQYALAAFHRLEYGTAHRGPLFAQLNLTSSHSPWTPLPEYVDWAALGDGTVFGPMARRGDPPEVLFRDSAKVRAAYASSVAYSLRSLVSFVQRYGDEDLVLLVVGDHQPAPVVTGANASRDVPVAMIAHDPAVLDRISGWGWQDGLNPGPTAPVWPMDSFRDRLLSTFER